jgi:hypothetical protein
MVYPLESPAGISAPGYQIAKKIFALVKLTPAKSQNKIFDFYLILIYG